jgi:hypothetical protein
MFVQAYSAADSESNAGQFYISSRPLRDDRRLSVFENRVLGRIFGSKRDEVTREWRKLRNEELNPSATEDIPTFSTDGGVLNSV